MEGEGQSGPSLHFSTDTGLLTDKLIRLLGDCNDLSKVFEIERFHVSPRAVGVTVRSGKTDAVKRPLFSSNRDDSREHAGRNVIQNENLDRTIRGRVPIGRVFRSCGRLLLFIIHNEKGRGYKSRITQNV